MNVLHKQIVVKLNRNWHAIAVVRVCEAVTFLASEHNSEKPGFAMDFETAVDENTGEHVLIYANPVAWDDWVNLPVRDNDMWIGTSSGKIRLPLVVICAKFAKVPMRTTRWSTGNVRVRDGGICQVSGRKLSHGQGNVGHDVAVSKGGRDTFENTAYIDSRLNTLQGTRTFAEMGWTLLKKPVAPKSSPVAYRKADAPVEAQKPFLFD